MYKCQICGTVSKPGEPRRQHVVHRKVPRLIVIRHRVEGQDGRIREEREVQEGFRTEVAAEIPVCQRCQRLLQEGVGLSELRQRYRGHYLASFVKPPRPKRYKPAAANGSANGKAVAHACPAPIEVADVEPVPAPRKKRKPAPTASVGIANAVVLSHPAPSMEERMAKGIADALLAVKAGGRGKVFVLSQSNQNDKGSYLQFKRLPDGKYQFGDSAPVELPEAVSHVRSLML